MTRRGARPGTARWFLKRAVGLFIVAVVLSGFAATAAIGPAAELLRYLFNSRLDQGWATLLGAVAGLGAIAYQTRSGFVNLTRSQAAEATRDRESRESQASIDRDARDHQFQLEVRRAAAQRQEERRALAAALNGELLAVHGKLAASRSTLTMQKALYESLGSDVPRGAPFRMQSIETPIFDASIQNLGLLEPTLISDLSEVFGVAKMKIDAPTTMNGTMTAKLIEVLIEQWPETNKDFLHVQRRLIAVQRGDPDPGSLYLDRKGRAAATATQ